MKEYFVVWESYSVDWILIEKGYHFLQVEEGGHLMNSLAEFCERMAESRNMNANRFTIDSVQSV